MTEAAAFTSLGIALALGLLVGLQRQRSEDRLGGIRTFTLVTVFGALAGILASETLPDGAVALRPGMAWIPAAALLALAVVLLIGQRGASSVARSAEMEDKPEKPALVTPGTPDSPGNAGRDVGLTTEIAMAVMFLVGVLVVVGPRSVAVALGAGVAVLLQAKFVLHRLVSRLGEKDLTAIFRFVLISLVILPVLPNETFGPFDVFNPHQTWLMVVLIVGMSLAGYVAYRLLGDRTGPILTGLLGGLVSSTATTASFARRSGDAPSESGHAITAVLIVLIAGTVSCVRVMVELAVVARAQFAALAPPVAIIFGASGLICVAAWLRARRSRTSVPPQSNPTELKAPIVFAVVYTLVQFAAAAAKDRLGQGGLYAVAAVSGLTDMDAITLSVGRMSADSTTSTDVAWRAIVVAIIANMVFKCGIVVVLGSRAMRRLMVLFTAAIVAAAVLVLWLWPTGVAAATPS